MSSDTAPHVDLNLPTPGFDESSSRTPANGNATLQDTKNSAYSFAYHFHQQPNFPPFHTLTNNQTAVQSAMDTVQNHPVTQNTKDTIVNGEVSPVGESIKSEHAKTTNEFKDLADSRTTPAKPAATGQPLTHYHSMFYRLLSWKNPRATAITFAVNLLLIFAGRYLNVIRYVFKGLYIVMGVTATAEVAGQALLGDGIATRMRPRKYFTIPKESLERFLDDFEQLINFFVIEFQRVLFAENIWATVAAFLTFFTSYWLIKWLPLWGLTLLFTMTIYMAPLIYIKNQEFIDEHLAHGKRLVNDQATQVKNLAAHHTSNAASTARSYGQQYSQKAQEYIGQAKSATASGTNGHTNVTKPVHDADFPTAPKEEPTAQAEIPKAQPIAEPAY